MRYAAASDTDPNLTTLLDAAQQEPVFIERDQQEIAVLVSAREYDRLSGKATREFKLDELLNTSEQPHPVADTDNSVVKYAVEVFGDAERASLWLNRPKYRFDGRTPTETLQTKEGAKAVEEMLGQIDEGMFA